MENMNKFEAFEIRKIIKRGIWMLIIPVISTLYPVLNNRSADAAVLETVVDKHIPFASCFIIPYMAWYAYVVFFLIYICIIDENAYWRLLASLIIGMLFSYGVFYIYPTCVPRPRLTGNDFFTSIVRWLYQKDNPYNCFPSIHVLNSMLVAIYVQKVEKFSNKVKGASCIIAASIVMSTVFIKQHVILDVVAGVLIAFILYMIVCIFDLYQDRNKNDKKAMDC